MSNHPAPWRKICVPIDFSQTSLTAFEHAVPVARQHGAELILLHVQRDPLQMAAEWTRPAMPASVADLQATLAGELERLKRRAIELGVSLVSTALVDDAQPYRGIVDFAEAAAVDLIVMGTHGRTGLKHFLVGSVAEHVVRLATCPVLTVGERAAHAAHPVLPPGHSGLRCVDLMHRNVGFVHPYDNLQAVASKMADLEVRFVPVCDATGHVLGALTDRDVLAKVVANDRTASECRADELMSRDVPLCGPDDDVRDVARRMTQVHARRAVVVSAEGVVLGVLSRSDIPPVLAG